MKLSFSKDDVTIGSDGSATVTHNGTPVELGSNFSKQPDGSIVVTDKKIAKMFRQINAKGAGRRGTARHMPSHS